MKNIINTIMDEEYSLMIFDLTDGMRSTGSVLNLLLSGVL